MKLTLSKSQWKLIGKTAGWLKKSQLTPEQQVEKDKAFASLDNLNIEVDEGNETSEQITQLQWSDKTENTYEKPTGKYTDSKDYTMKISGVVYYPDSLQAEHGTLQNFVRGYEDGWKDDLVIKEEIKDINWESFQLDNFVEKKIDDENYQVLAQYSFSTESEPYYPEPNDERI